MGHWMTSPLRLISGEAVPQTEDGRGADGRHLPAAVADGRATCGVSDGRPDASVRTDGRSPDGLIGGLTGAAVKQQTVVLSDRPSGPPPVGRSSVPQRSARDVRQSSVV
jgi:hypothetical protein